MDKLTENKFWIAVSATALLLAGLVFWLIYLPMAELRKSQGDLAKEIGRLKKAEKWEFLPTKDRWEHLQAKSAAEVDALNLGIGEYDALGKRFREYFDDAKEPPDVSDFGARYTDELNKLIGAYREEFGIQAPQPANPDVPGAAVEVQDALPPEVDRIERSQLHPERVEVSMKEFWMTQSVIETCQKLKLGGLQKVTFEGRDAQDKDPAETHTWRPVTVDIDLPYSQAENLLTELLTGDRVHFRVQKLDIQKPTASVIAHRALVIEEEFEQYAEATARAYVEVAPEPDVKMQLVLGAFDWKGMKSAEVKSADDDDEDDDGGKGGKKGKGRGRGKKKNR